MPVQRPLIRYGRYGAVAFEFSGTIAAGVAMGWLLDDWLGTAPYLLVVATLAAVVGGFIRLIEVLRRFDRLDHSAEP